MRTSTITETGQDVDTPTGRASAVFLLLGGVAFFVAGGIHPKGGGESQGTKVAQLHEMLTDPMWYPAHVVFLAAMVFIAAGVVALRRRRDLDGNTERVVRVVTWTTIIGALAMAVHLFAATAAPGMADGDATFAYQVHVWNETLVNPIWGLSVAALAVAGGLGGTLGNRITLVIGLLGGVAFALATATIAFTDALDPLFPLSSLIGIWAAAVGARYLLRR